MKPSKRPIMLIILDGWGYTEQREHNAIALANTPHWDQFWQNHPKTLLQCSGEAVGLPHGQMGNSEVGHMHIGAGHLLEQDLVRINNAIADQRFFSNPAFLDTLKNAHASGHAVHVIGLLSAGGVHSHEDHLFALCDLAKNYDCPFYIHAILDGRDTAPKSAERSLQTLQTLLKENPNARLASISGRYYAMDRDKRFERTQRAYDCMVSGVSTYSNNDPLLALKAAYQRGETDEFVSPTAIFNQSPITIDDHDQVIFMNFRSDRMRQLVSAFIDTPFTGFARQSCLQLANVVTLTNYTDAFDCTLAFPSKKIRNTLGETLSQANLSQLRVAETEKYAHVTFFFNGGREQPFPSEKRLLIPSPKVATYDLQPEMSAPAITEALQEALLSDQFDALIVNYANADMVGHTGNLDASIQAVECVDRCLGALQESLKKVGGEAIITADHGNVESLYNPTTQQTHTAHTGHPVPFVYLGERSMEIVKTNASLIDIAPTFLYLSGIKPPDSMQGQSILRAIS